MGVLRVRHLVRPVRFLGPVVVAALVAAGCSGGSGGSDGDTRAGPTAGTSATAAGPTTPPIATTTAEPATAAPIATTTSTTAPTATTAAVLELGTETADLAARLVPVPGYSYADWWAEPSIADEQERLAQDPVLLQLFDHFSVHSLGYLGHWVGQIEVFEARPALTTAADPASVVRHAFEAREAGHPTEVTMIGATEVVEATLDDGPVRCWYRDGAAYVVLGGDHARDFVAALVAVQEGRPVAEPTATEPLPADTVLPTEDADLTARLVEVPDFLYADPSIEDLDDFLGLFHGPNVERGTLHRVFESQWLVGTLGMVELVDGQKHNAERDAGRFAAQDASGFGLTATDRTIGGRTVHVLAVAGLDLPMWAWFGFDGVVYRLDLRDAYPDAWADFLDGFLATPV